MKLFSSLYDKVMGWAKHPHAELYLGSLSFAESSFFPVPPDIMLIPMVMARPQRWLWLAALTTAASVIGGIAGYLIGAFAFDILHPLILEWGYGDKLEQAKNWFEHWGVWAVVVAGFSPIPYKIFTITAGLLSMALIPFTFASIIGRGARFFIVSALLAWLGPRMEPLIIRYIEWLGWIIVAALLLIVLMTQV
ncbi:MAG: DedA family protein [Thiothrix sp.]|nr:DedA family protein [Thiothrix sp.]HPQ94319.1 YqaA family protein [Thiolinea sp.]